MDEWPREVNATSHIADAELSVGLSVICTGLPSTAKYNQASVCSG